MTKHNSQNSEHITEIHQPKTSGIPLNEGTYSKEIAKATPTTSKPPVTKK
jgi:hypothetical protein